jgi:regulator of sirC expression with transglutaminase-like and TPR domain
VPVDALRELLTADNASVTLDVASLDLARIEHPNLDPAQCLRELDAIAAGLGERTGDAKDGLRFLQLANAYLFDELGFHGNKTFYYDPRNSCLNDVIAFRTGIPLTLSILYMEIARRLGMTIRGVSAPGHFIVRFDDGRVSLYADPFDKGRIMDKEQCRAMIRQFSKFPVTDEVLRPATAKQVMVRMLRNLEGAYVRLKNFEKALQVSDMLRISGEEGQGPLAQWPATPN